MVTAHRYASFFSGSTANRWGSVCNVESRQVLWSACKGWSSPKSSPILPWCCFMVILPLKHEKTLNKYHKSINMGSLGLPPRIPRMRMQSSQVWNMKGPGNPEMSTDLNLSTTSTLGPSATTVANLRSSTSGGIGGRLPGLKPGLPSAPRWNPNQPPVLAFPIDPFPAVATPCSRPFAKLALLTPWCAWRSTVVLTGPIPRTTSRPRGSRGV